MRRASEAVFEPLQVAHHGARGELLAVERVVDEQPHQLLGLRDGGRVLEPPAIEVDQREMTRFSSVMAFSIGHESLKIRW